MICLQLKLLSFDYGSVAASYNQGPVHLVLWVISLFGDNSQNFNMFTCDFLTLQTHIGNTHSN
jgi:hypothetical protein